VNFAPLRQWQRFLVYQCRLGVGRPRRGRALGWLQHSQVISLSAGRAL